MTAQLMRAQGKDGAEAQDLVTNDMVDSIKTKIAILETL